MPQADTISVLSTDPIGVFDSGVGGLTILAALRRQLPAERYIYFGDTANCPYGVRDDAEIIALSIEGCRFLVDRGCKLLVVACNTASQAALAGLRATFALPIVGVVPAVKPAAQLTHSGRIGVAATDGAARSPYLARLIADFAADVQVWTAGCSELVPLVERGELDSPATEAAVRRLFAPLLAADVDVIALACTHFPALRPLIERVAGPGVTVIDSGEAIARRTRTVLEENQLLRESVPLPGRLELWCSGDPARFGAVAASILGEAATARAIGAASYTSSSVDRR